MDAGSKRMTSKGWCATLVSILWTRLTLQNWRAKIDLFPVGGDGLYLIKEKHNPDGPRRLNAPPRLIFAQFFGLKPRAYFQIKTDFSLVSS
jgi:hypothetical protein